jgi:WD40 repeat protein
VHQDPSRTLIAVAERENTVVLWDTRRKDPSMKLTRARTIKGLAQQLIFTNNGNSLVCHGSSSTLVWDVRMQQIAATIEGRDANGRTPSQVSVLEDSGMLLAEYASPSSSSMAKARLFSLQNGEERWEYSWQHATPWHDDGPLPACHTLSPDGAMILRHAPGGALTLSKSHRGEFVCETPSSEGTPPEVGTLSWNPRAFCSSGSDIIGSSVWASGDMSGRITLWGTDEKLREAPQALP